MSSLSQEATAGQRDSEATAGQRDSETLDTGLSHTNQDCYRGNTLPWIMEGNDITQQAAKGSSPNSKGM